MRRTLALTFMVLSTAAIAAVDEGQGQTVLAATACTSAATAAGHRIQCRFPDRESLGPASVSDDSARVVESVSALQAASGEAGDWRGGIWLSGEGGGGTDAILQSLALPDDRLRGAITVVKAQMPHTLFSDDHVGGDREAWRAWQGVDLSPYDFRSAAALGAVDHVYYRIHGSTRDRAGQVNLDFFRLCDTYRIACFGTWHGGGHQQDEPDITLPAQVFTDPGQGVYLDQVLPVFTNSSANLWGERGHYNLGLSWDSAGIISNKNAIVVPLRYQRFTGLTSAPRTKPLPDQPDKVTFNLTLRRIGPLGKSPGRGVQWRLMGTSQKGGSVVAADGSITITGIKLSSSEAYSRLRVTPLPAKWQLVYTRQPRATKPVPGTPIMEAANWQHASDVGRINQGLAEADVVIDDLNGNTRVIYNCTKAEEICVAHEARVSPDGTRIVYSVGYGNTFTDVYYEGIKLGIKDIPELTHARLWIYDLATGENTPIPNHPSGAIDRQPEWLTNEKIVFASNRGKTYPFRNPTGMHEGYDQYGRGRCFNYPYCVSQDYGYGLASQSMQLWTMNIDGTEARNITPHENNALAPAVMSNGDILYSCWNAHENKSFDKYNTHSNYPQTVKNKWWLCRTDGNGADTTVLLNGHVSPTLKTREWLPQGVTGGEGRAMLRAIRSVAEIFKGKLAISNYYRSNHVGSMGIIYSMDYGDPHVEGCSTAACQPDSERRSSKPGSGHYLPSSFRAVTPYGNDQDIEVRRDANNRPMGKAGYAAPLPNTDTEFLMTHARGSCYEVTPLRQVNRKAMRGEPTCQKALYKVKVPMVTNPFDQRQMELLAGGERWQVYDGRAIATYQSLHGQPMPEQPEPLSPDSACYLQVVDARQAELYPSADRYNWKTNLYEQCAFQGCAVNTEDAGFHERNMAALKIYLPEMWDISWRGKNQKEYLRYLNNMGHKTIATLGSQPLQPDGSVKMRVPCETPLLMAGVDRHGMVIAHDAMLHSLRRGETRSCHGCHDGHSEERAARIGMPAAQRFSKTQAFNTNPPMPKQQPPLLFSDIQPIIEKRCSGCHKDMTNADGLLYSRIAQDYEQIDWDWAKKHLGHGEHNNIRHVIIKQPGRGYAVGEELVFKGGGARGKIAAVGPGGEIRKIRLTAGGDGYQPKTSVSVKTAAGQGAKLTAMTRRFELGRPYTSKWVAKFARDSLLYWKCMGSRQDGRTDDQYRNDIDFGPPHDSGATPEECRKIGRWIDSGIQHILR